MPDYFTYLHCWHVIMYGHVGTVGCVHRDFSRFECKGRAVCLLCGIRANTWPWSGYSKQSLFVCVPLSRQVCESFRRYDYSSLTVFHQLGFDCIVWCCMIPDLTNCTKFIHLLTRARIRRSDQSRRPGSGWVRRRCWIFLLLPWYLKENIFLDFIENR